MVRVVSWEAEDVHAFKLRKAGNPGLLLSVEVIRQNMGIIHIGTDLKGRVFGISRVQTSMVYNGLRVP